jgi:endonuclease/exonuclease/phosphatase family metal-dependent hydrolase
MLAFLTGEWHTAGHMRIASHNLRFLFGEGKHRHSGKDWTTTAAEAEARVAHYVKVFAALDADVLFLQELGSEDALRRILDRVPGAYDHFLAVPDENGVGNAVVFRRGLDCACSSVPAKAALPTLAAGDSDTLGARVWSRRDYVRVEMPFAGAPLVLLGVHLKSTFLVPMRDAGGAAVAETGQLAFADGLIRSEAFRFAQARRVRLEADTALGPAAGGAFIAAGDLNAEPGTTVFRMMQGDVNAPGALWSPAEMLPEAERYTIATKGRKRMLDNMLLSSALRDRVASFRMERGGDVAEAGSDHSPIVLELREG